MNYAIPITERLIGILEDRASKMGKTIALWSASITLPMPWLSGDRINLFSPAAWAAHPFRPALADKISTTGVFIGKHFLELSDGKLVNWLWLFGAGHGYLPTMEKHYHG